MAAARQGKNEFADRDLAELITSAHPAALGVGRGRKMTYALGYQNIAQLYHQYGADGGDAVLGWSAR